MISAGLSSFIQGVTTARGTLLRGTKNVPDVAREQPKVQHSQGYSDKQVVLSGWCLLLSLEVHRGLSFTVIYEMCCCREVKPFASVLKGRCLKAPYS